MGRGQLGTTVDRYEFMMLLILSKEDGKTLGRKEGN